jgi:hypothetical protein
LQIESGRIVRRIITDPTAGQLQHEQPETGYADNNGLVLCHGRSKITRKPTEKLRVFWDWIALQFFYILIQLAILQRKIMYIRLNQLPKS